MSCELRVSRVDSDGGVSRVESSGFRESHIMNEIYGLTRPYPHFIWTATDSCFGRPLRTADTAPPTTRTTTGNEREGHTTTRKGSTTSTTPKDHATSAMGTESKPGVDPKGPSVTERRPSGRSQGHMVGGVCKRNGYGKGAHNVRANQESRKVHGRHRWIAIDGCHRWMPTVDAIDVWVANGWQDHATRDLSEVPRPAINNPGYLAIGANND